MVQLKSMNKFDVFVGHRKGREGNPARKKFCYNTYDG